jgi:hypothetical protein
MSTAIRLSPIPWWTIVRRLQLFLQFLLVRRDALNAPLLTIRSRLPLTTTRKHRTTIWTISHTKKFILPQNFPPTKEGPVIKKAKLFFITRVVPHINTYPTTLSQAIIFPNNRCAYTNNSIPLFGSWQFSTFAFAASIKDRTS